MTDVLPMTVDEWKVLHSCRLGAGLTISDATLHRVRLALEERERLLHVCGATICPDCDGTGILGVDGKGRKYACEKCGGHEDAAGRGWILDREEV